MLPEFLYSAGNSMQDISRDDFTLLNGVGSEKDSCNYNLQVHGTVSPLTNVIAAPSPTPISPAITSGSAVRSQLYESPPVGIKLEDNNTVDLFPTHPTTWQQHPMNSHEHAHHRHQHRTILNTGTNKLLLQGSDDPFISRGANCVADDDPPAEFSTLVEAVKNGTIQLQNQKQNQPRTNQQQNHQAQRLQQQAPQPHRPLNGCSSLTKQQLKVKASQMSSQNSTQVQNLQPAVSEVHSKPRVTKPKKKSAIKLRFHHQALPPEYLSHYEATQGQNETKTPHKKEVVPVKLTQAAKLLPPKSAHENVRSWLQKIAEIQRASQQPDHTHDVNNNKPTQKECATNRCVSPLPNKGSPLALECVLQNPMQDHDLTHPSALETHANSEVHSVSQQHKKIIKYSDLPYMGEMTLDNSKPRRGRKPKKADICHLIYKNYGTIFPGTPKNKLNKTSKTDFHLAAIKAEHEAKTALDSFEEPLNLCLRDQSADSYSISSDDDDEPDSSRNSNCPTPVVTAADVATDTFLATNLKLSISTPIDPMVTLVAKQQKSPIGPTANQIKGHELVPTLSANILLHPMSLYYQKLIESGTLIAQNGQSLNIPVETIQHNNQLALKIPIPSGLFLTPKQEKSSPVSTGNPLEYPEPMSTPSSIKSENSIATSATTNSSVNCQNQQHPPPKRKRSAIFIPPMPAENPNNPPSEVSICKFKFTGGAKPTLQEKKMLSVDSDGNYRYYSGTGDKSMRGYEFFPRESLQQSGFVPGVNCSGAFLNATGEKIMIDLPPPSAELSNELLQIPDSPTSNLLLPTVGIAMSTVPPTSKTTTHCAVPPQSSTPESNRSSSQQPQVQITALRNNSNQISNTIGPHESRTQSISLCQRSLERKKKTRRSTQREKLEKTFKEKGFLIQTQQLESAEGATYCKFRQLKKFTRYLFRNWKDYLPDELQQANEAAAAALNHEVKHTESTSSTIFTGRTSPESSIDSILENHGFGSNERLMEDCAATRYSPACMPTKVRVALDRVQNAAVENAS